MSRIFPTITDLLHTCTRLICSWHIARFQNIYEQDFLNNQRFAIHGDSLNLNLQNNHYKMAGGWTVVLIQIFPVKLIRDGFACLASHIDQVTWIIKVTSQLLECLNISS